MKALINKKLVLEKFHGKGGWTYVQVPGIQRSGTTPFGWVKVKGSIDGYAITKYHLMPMGKGRLFLPVKAEIRKKIKKEEGDFVHIILYADNEPLEVPEEMLLCLQEEPQALKFFNSLTESERKYYIDWVYSAKKEETKIDRLAKTINRLLQRLKMYDKALGS
jgi:bifunctional DNA-binding transcriptional regulator/antitoxin component of YhaV-PrlF toxin-antitoxin module